MAAPLALIAKKMATAAAKQAAKNSAKKAAAKAVSGGGEDSADSGSNSIILKVVAIGLIVSIGAIAFFATAVMTGLGNLLPSGPTASACVFFPDSGEADEMPPELESGKVGSEATPSPSPASDSGTPAGDSNVGSLTDTGDNLVFPLPAKFQASTSSSYGWRIHPIQKIAKFHYGTDVAAPTGTPLYAIGAGKVIHASVWFGGGNTVAVEHNVNGKKIQTWNLHLSVIDVKLGDMVSTGQIIGRVGSTGNSTGPHLHLEVRDGTRYQVDNIDPRTWMGKNNLVALSGEGDEVTPAPGTEQIYDLDIETLSGAEVCDFNRRQSGKLVSANKQWGNHSNGKIPEGKLKKPKGVGDFLFNPSAAESLEQVNEFYKEKFGKSLPINIGYEDIKAQEYCIENEKNRADLRLLEELTPEKDRSKKDKVLIETLKEKVTGEERECPVVGKSNFGWGMSLQFKAPLNDQSTEEYKWIKSQFETFGWLQPDVGGIGDYGYWEYSGMTGSLNADGTTPEGAKQIARALFPRYSWDMVEFGCLEKLWERESHWKYQAKNSSSGAYGIPQALPASKMASVAKDWETNPKTQIEWGLKYIYDRYKKPCAALDHSDTIGWY